MPRRQKVFIITPALIAVALLTAACGTQKISVPTSQPAAYRGAVLFSQRCAGCHTLSYAATHGSAANIRDREPINGPNFNQRCERPLARVLYAIENGGFSGAYMPQNIVVGQDAKDVAVFVAQYAGRQAPIQPGSQGCDQKAIGTLPGGDAGPSGTGPNGTGPVSQTGTGTGVATTPTSQTTPASGTTPQPSAGSGTGTSPTTTTK